MPCAENMLLVETQTRSKCAWLSCCRRRRPLQVTAVETLNDNPHNVRAEELALEECMRGVDVRRTWSEASLVVNFGGVMSAGTPDGMFEDWNSDLTCVQVVRVPIDEGMDAQEIDDALYQTVLTKIVKSQNWMECTGTLPKQFIIFCWLPRLKHGYPEVCGRRTQALLEHVRSQGWPFHVRAMVPDRNDDLFPAKFAFNQTCREGHVANSDLGRRSSKPKSRISEADLSTKDPSCLGNDCDDDDEMCFNIFDFDSASVAATEDTASPEAQDFETSCSVSAVRSTNHDTPGAAEQNHDARRILSTSNESEVVDS